MIKKQMTFIVNGGKRVKPMHASYFNLVSSLVCIVYSIGYQYTCADDKADTICCEWQQSIPVLVIKTPYTHSVLYYGAQYPEAKQYNEEHEQNSSHHREVPLKLQFRNTVKPVLSGHSRKDPKICL